MDTMQELLNEASNAGYAVEHDGSGDVIIFRSDRFGGVTGIKVLSDDMTVAFHGSRESTGVTVRAALRLVRAA